MNDSLFMEKSIIIKQLLIKEENPFTGEKLTEDELDTYNNLPEKVIKLEDFKKRFQEWKNINIV
jgi:hypothetical protein